MSDAPEKVAAAVPQLNDEPVVQEQAPEAVQSGEGEVVDKVRLTFYTDPRTRNVQRK